MERKFQCPSCGAGNIVTNPGILMKICDYCKTAIYWDKDSALRVGSKSMDLPQSPRFKTGGVGKLQGRIFKILGRLTYEHESGFWHEWFIEFDDGSLKWLTEDEGELFIETPIKVKQELPLFDKLRPGMQFQLGNNTGIVEELGEARVIGGEGQIPRDVEIGETYSYVDGTSTDGKHSFGLEYDSSGAPEVFWGRIVNLKNAKAKSFNKDAPESKYGETIHCANCGKPYEGRLLGSTKSVTCASCGSILELSEAQTKVIGSNSGAAPPFTFEIGTPLIFNKIQYEVMGRMLYDQLDEGLHYFSREYILYSPSAGYRRLVEENGHFLLGGVGHVAFTPPMKPKKKQRVKIGDKTYKWFESGKVELVWVEGALPWRAGIGETTRFTHLINPPEFVEYEITGTEAELFKGRYVEPQEMSVAAPKFTTLPQPCGIHSAQPYTPSKWLKGLWKIALVFIVVNSALGLYTCAVNNPRTLVTEHVTADNYKNEYLSKLFRIEKPGILRIFGSAPVYNSWLALSFALVDSDDKVVSETDGELSFYSGRDSEGNWSEGSKNFSTEFLVKKPGDYKLLIYGIGGSGDKAGPARDEAADITLQSGVSLAWYFWIPIVFAIILALLQPIKKMLFESKRWG